MEHIQEMVELPFEYLNLLSKNKTEIRTIQNKLRFSKRKIAYYESQLTYKI